MEYILIIDIYIYLYSYIIYAFERRIMLIYVNIVFGIRKLQLLI